MKRANMFGNTKTNKTGKSTTRDKNLTYTGVDSFVYLRPLAVFIGSTLGPSV
jgi:hypothetical protein